MNLFDTPMHTLKQSHYLCGLPVVGFIHAELFGPCGAQVEKVCQGITVYLL